jgi:Tol biopolymer transport system component
MVDPRISPDQKSVVFSVPGVSYNTWLLDVERGNSTRFIVGPSSSSLVWSPEGSRIAYYAYERSSNEHLVMEGPASGMGKDTVLYRSTGIFLLPESWSQDGRWLMLMAPVSGAFYLLPMSGEGSGGERKPIPFPESPLEGRHPAISPDRRWLLYSSTQTGRREVFVESMPESMGGPAAGAKKQVSIAGGAQPVWRADGRRSSTSPRTAR